MGRLLDHIPYVIVLMLSLSVHEWAHAFSAFKLGDDTASAQGRLTLNPMSHIDPLGTVILPLLGVPFGWARPVPYNPARFRRDISMRTGSMIVAAAGPASNVVLALLSAFIMFLALRFAPAAYGSQPALHVFLQSMVIINALLALFNMLPIPPLDGSKVLDRFVPLRLRPRWERFCQIGPAVLLAVIFLPHLLGDVVPGIAMLNPIYLALGYVRELLDRITMMAIYG